MYFLVIYVLLYKGKIRAGTYLLGVSPKFTNIISPLGRLVFEYKIFLALKLLTRVKQGILDMRAVSLPRNSSKNENIQRRINRSERQN